MGVGKTSIGKKLAKQMGWHFFDTDKQIEKKNRFVYSRNF